MNTRWIQIDNNNRVIFSAISETFDCIEIKAPESFDYTFQNDWEYINNTLIYNPLPEEEEEYVPSEIDYLQADIDYLLMENEFLENQNEQQQADIDFCLMLLEDEGEN